MPTKKIKISFLRVDCLRESAIYGAASWVFEAKVDGKAVGNASTKSSVVPGNSVALDSTWSAEVDVSGKKPGDVIEASFQVYEKKLIGSVNQGKVTLKFNYPFQQEMDYDFYGSAEGLLKKTRQFLLRATMKITEAVEAPPPASGVPVGKHGGGDTVSTVSGDVMLPRVEVSPVVPVLKADQRPPRPDFDKMVPHGVDTSAAKQVALTGSLDLNTLANPSLIPVLKTTVPEFEKRAARIAVTYMRPHNLEVDRLHWVIKKGPIKIHGKSSGCTEILVYGTAESPDPAEIELRWGDPGGPVLSLFRAFVGPVKIIPTRATIVNGTTVATTHRSKPADVERHIKLANVLLYQSGILLVPDYDKRTWDGAVADASHEGIFSLTTADHTMTLGVNDNIPPHPMRLNFRPGAMHLVYVKSLKDADAVGVAVDRPKLTGNTVSLSGTPSTSWVPPTGVDPDKASASVSMITMTASKARNSKEDTDYLAARKVADPTTPDDAYDGLFGCIMPDYAEPSDEDWPQTLAHEVGHVLGLRHRGNPQTKPAEGKVGSNDGVNGYGGKGHPWLENVMSYGYKRSQDLDLIQTTVVRKHPSVLDKPPVPPKPPGPKPPVTDKLKDLQSRLGVPQTGVWDAATESAASSKMVKNGSTGPVVGWVQEQLNAQGMNSGDVDEICGPITSGAIRRWQESKPDLSNDSVAGPRTMQSLAEA